MTSLRGVGHVPAFEFGFYPSIFNSDASVVHFPPLDAAYVPSFSSEAVSNGMQLASPLLQATVPRVPSYPLSFNASLMNAPLKTGSEKSSRLTFSVCISVYSALFHVIFCCLALRVVVWTFFVLLS